MSESPLIPAEARNAAEEAMVEFFIGRKGDQHGLDAMLEAAAPHIARAARIDELKRLLVGQETSYNLRTDEAGHYVKSTVIETRIAELEADR